MSEVTKDVLRIVGQIAVRQIQRRIREGRVRPRTNKKGTTLVGAPPTLINSIRNEARGSGVVISAGGMNVPYARIHHEGGIIRPKHGQYLAIPLTPKAKLYKPRMYPGETFIRKGVIFVKDGTKITPIYALKKQVTIPARPYMLLDDHDRHLIEAAVAERVQKEVDRLGRIERE